MGNQNYPSIFSLKMLGEEEILIHNHRVPMQIRLASFSNLILTEGGYFITGGIGDRFKNTKFSTFMFDPYSFEAVELEPMVTARFRFGII